MQLLAYFDMHLYFHSTVITFMHTRRFSNHRNVVEANRKLHSPMHDG